MRSNRFGKPELTNIGIAELLAAEAESATPPLHRALRKAARSAFLWEVEASALLAQDRSLTELPAVGPFLARLIGQWLADPPRNPPVSKLRQGFLTIPQARKILAGDPFGGRRLRGDLQMH